MSTPVVVALAAVLVATAVRGQRRPRRQNQRKRTQPASTLDALVLVPTLALLCIGVAATLLAVGRVLNPATLTATGFGLAVAIWPWQRAAQPRPPPVRALNLRTAALVLTVLGAAALRLWPMDYALAGRDQGTYTLRAEHIARTGALDLSDPVLAAASHQRKRRSGPGDILGLLPTSGERWRKDRYEGAYRPGLYLADRHRGHVVPQFFHLHPVLMACAQLALGPRGPGALIVTEGLLTLLAIAALSRRLWPGGPWAALPVALLAVAPLVIWVQRNALSEVPAMLLLWAAALAVARAGDDEADGLTLAALLLGATAWVRGHGLLIAPAVGVVLWALPQRHRRSAAVYGALVLGSVLVHAGSVYPYLHDELARILPGLHPTPEQWVVGSASLALAWDGVHRLRIRSRGGGDACGSAVARAPAVAVAAFAVALVLWLGLRATSPAKPFARLDPAIPLIGPVVALAAAAGLWKIARTRLRVTPRSVWIAALAAAWMIPIMLYARRNLPQGGLYYYGRYIVPELWPLLALAATHALQLAWARWRGHSWATVAASLGATVLVGVTALPLLTDPATRIREFDGARRVVELLASAVPPGAVVIAGGEGWHHGHTFNQVGGALLLSHGITVLPYRSREAAYATLHALLVADPKGARLADRPVFLLVNEATKPYRVRDSNGKPTGPKTAASDDLLDAPFAAQEVLRVEMFVHRLTPVTDTVPTRVTRDELRMVLVHVVVDPQRAKTVERIDPPGGTDPRCLTPKRNTKITLPRTGAAGEGPVSIVVVASPGTSRSNETWSLSADGVPLPMRTVGGRPRPRDTLGPFLLHHRPSQITVVGAKRRHRKAACPHGGIDEIRLLPIPHAMNADARTSTHTIAPPRDLGHPVQPVAWVSGRGLSKARPGILSQGGKLTAAGPSLVLRAGQTLTFPLEALPGGGTEPTAVVVTLSRSTAGTGARLDLLWDEKVVATISPPPDRARSWQSEPIVIVPTAPLSRVGVRLQSEREGAAVHLRDIGLFVQPRPATPQR